MKKLLFSAAMLLLSSQLFAQRQAQAPAAAAPPVATRDVSGIVKDDKGETVIGANITLSDKLDTIRAASNADGIFVLHNVKMASFTLQIQSIGYKPQVLIERLNDTKKQLTLEPIILKDDSKELNTVTINGTPSIVYKTDTVQYRASDYKVRENSTVDELLKHMEGFEVGSDGSVTHQGQAVTKARLNGRDYAGGNLAQAIQNLPAEIVENIQVVDDYGDQAARTGVKDGDPTKVLNITTLANKSIGYTLRLTANEGTDDRYNDQLFLNRINANQVMVVNLNTQNTVNGVANQGAAGSGSGQVNSTSGPTGGTTTRDGATFSYRDQVNRTTQINASYTYSLNDVFALSSQNAGQFNALGTTVDTTNAVSRSRTPTQAVTMDYEVSPDSNNYFRFRPNFTYSDATSNVQQTSNSVGLQNEATSQTQIQTTTSPVISLFGTYQYLWKHDKRENLSIGYTYTSTGSNQTQTTNEHILYRTAASVPVLDSLVNRTTTNNSTTNASVLTLQYVKPLTRPSAPVQQRLEFNEKYSYTGYNVTDVQSNISPTGALVPIDSISNIYHYSFSQINLAAQYALIGPKTQLTIGARALSTDLAGDNISRNTTTNRTDFYILPVFRFQYQWTRTEQLQINYNGAAAEPTFGEIQPVANFNNPQSPVYGNPDLKPQFTHTITARFNDYIANSKFNFSLNTRTSLTEDQIVQNNVAVEEPITVGGKTSENVIDQIHYLNTNGGLAETASYNMAKQLNDRAVNLELNGLFSYNYNPIYSNNLLYHQTLWEVNERFGPIITLPTFDIRPYISYDDSRNFTNLPNNNPLAPTSANVQTTASELQGRIFIGKDKRMAFEYDLIKNYITGITGYNKKPFVVNSYVEYEFFARKNGILRLSAFDIFDQNTYLAHVQTTTGYTNTQSNALSRYFSAQFILNLNKFGGTPQRNGRTMNRRGDGSFIVD